MSICLVPKSSKVLGEAAYLGAITTVFAHPGRRFGQLVEASILALAGTMLGLAWSLFGLFLSSQLITLNSPAAHSIRGVFLACACIFHGFLRSNTPRLFVFVLLLIIVSVVTLTSTAAAVSSVSATQILYPILVAVGVIFLVNLFIFPEFSSSFLGETTMETLHDTAESLRNAGHYFTVSLRQYGDPKTSSADTKGWKKVEESNKTLEKMQTRSVLYRFLHRLLQSKEQGAPDIDSPSEATTISLQDLIGAKAKLRSKLSTCKAAQTECNFEVAFAVLPPRLLKPISKRSMKRLVANVVAIIGACESKFALLGEGNERVSNVDDGTEPKLAIVDRGLTQIDEKLLLEMEPHKKADRTEIDLIKPKREIEYGDARLLQHLLKGISVPYTNFNIALSRAMDCVTICIAYAYDVPTLPSGAKAPKGLLIEEVDLHTEELNEAVRTFDSEITATLEGVVEIQGFDGQQLDVMPREEIFLVASFVLNLRQAANHIEEMLRTSRFLVLQRQLRHDRRRFYAPRIKWSKWLYSGGEEVEALPPIGRKRNRSGEENETADEETHTDPVVCNENLNKSTSGQQDVEQGLGAAQIQQKSHPQSTKTSRAKIGPTSERREDEGILLNIRGRMADTLEWAQDSDDVLYAFKLSVAVFLVTWPAFVARWNQWYSLNRGCK